LPGTDRVRVKPVAVVRPVVAVAEELTIVFVTDATVIVTVVTRLVLVLVTVEGLVLLLPLSMLMEATVRLGSEVEVAGEPLRVT
jgi:hypothetical protein